MTAPSSDQKLSTNDIDEPEASPAQGNAIAAWFRADSFGRVVALAAFFATLLLLFSVLPAQGLTDDDDFYAPAGIRYAGWLGDAVTAPSKAFSQAGVDAAFKINHEHPPLAKYVIGIAHAVTHKALPIFSSLDGARAGTAFMAALLIALLIRLCWRPFGPVAAVFAGAATLALPRLFFHAQVATLDVPVATMVVATTAAFFWAEKDRKWAIFAGVVFGLALLTKLNAPFAAFPCTLFAVLCRWRGFSFSGGSQQTAPGIGFPPLPRSLVWMLFLGPVIFVALWPWLWFDGFRRFGAYVAFHLGHYPIYLFYQGEIFTKPFAPWHMPFVMALGVTPLPSFVLGLVGVGVGARGLVRITRHADIEGRVEVVSDEDKLAALLLLQALFAIGIVAFSNVPKYGGAKLFMPFFPLFMGLAGLGFARTARALLVFVPALAGVSAWLHPLEPHRGEAGRALEPDVTSSATIDRRLARLAMIALALVTLLPGALVSVKTFGGFGLSSYSAGVGGLRGATASGYERTYYDIADKELARWLDANANGRQVHFEPNHKEYVRTYRWLAKDGYISRKLRLTKKMKKAGLVVLTHERRWKTYPGLLEDVRSLNVVYEKRIDGVPLYTVYER